MHEAIRKAAPSQLAIGRVRKSPNFRSATKNREGGRGGGGGGGGAWWCVTFHIGNPIVSRGEVRRKGAKRKKTKESQKAQREWDGHKKTNRLAPREGRKKAGMSQRERDVRVRLTRGSAKVGPWGDIKKNWVQQMAKRGKRIIHEGTAEGKRGGSKQRNQKTADQRCKMTKGEPPSNIVWEDV